MRNNMLDEDSDLSEASDDAFTETNVLLGYASKQVSEDTTSYLGGKPTWLDPTTPPPASLARCKICNDMMALLLQLNSDLPEFFPGHERRLYVFSCRRKQCRRKEGSVRAIRGTRHVRTGERLDNNIEASPINPARKSPEFPRIDIGERIFGTTGLGKGGGENPFSASSSGNPFTSSTGMEGPLDYSTQTATKETHQKDVLDASERDTDPSAALPQTFASALNLNISSTDPAPAPEPWPSEASLPAPYPTFYLSEAEYEALEPSPTPILVSQKGAFDFEGSPTGSGDQEDKETFESSLDKTFQRFADRVAQNPEQCIRYEFGGEVLLYSKADVVGKMLSHGHEGLAREHNGKHAQGIPRCGNCGSERKFEVQIMPHSIMMLESEETSMDGMEWGTVVLGVCGSDCQERGKEDGEAGHLEAWVGVQWEESK